MTEQHPITPPDELVSQWRRDYWDDEKEEPLRRLVTKAAQWGADQELEACIGEADAFLKWDCVSKHLRATRRPKPPSLKQQALEALDSAEWFTDSLQEVGTIRRALEQLNDD